MVIFAAVGGRMSLIGVVYGTLLINFGKTAFSESFPELWLFLMGGLFISVVMFFPNGLAGLWLKGMMKLEIKSLSLILNGHVKKEKMDKDFYTKLNMPVIAAPLFLICTTHSSNPSEVL